jgi:uncharacterized membrane protein YfcA
MKKNFFKKLLIGFGTGILNGLFGAGGGSVLVPLMEKFLQIDEYSAHATAIPVILIMSVVSSFLYLRKGFFNFGIWVFVSAGGLIGGLVGAKLLKKVPKKWLKIGFGTVICITAIKMIF